MKIMTKAFTILVFCACFLFLGQLPQASAVNTGTVGILPAYPDPNISFSNSWFIYKLDLGKSKDDAIRVINNKQETAIIKLYAVDATITTDGGFALLSEDDARKDVGGWVKLALNEVEIPAKSEKMVPFTITIPMDADAGDHAGGIIMQELEGPSSQPAITGTGVKIVTRVGVRIYETVPGEVRRDSSISRFDWQMQPDEKAGFIKRFLGLDQKTLFFLGIENKGNMKISPKAKIEVKNIFGRTVGSIATEEMGVVFPRTKTLDSVLTWQGMPIVGRYTASLEVNFGEGTDKGNKEIVIWAVPYRLITILLFLFVLIVLARLFLQYLKEARKEKMPIYGVKPGDTLAGLSKKFQINWKKLAKANGIKKPFEIKPGQKLFVPMTSKNFEILKQLYRQHEIERSIAERSGAKKKSRKKLIVIIVVILLVGIAVYWFKFRKPATPSVQQNAEDQSSNQEAPKESTDKTITGVAKKSAIMVKIYTLDGTEAESSQRLKEKLDLIGYQTELMGSAADKNYTNTTIEHSPESVDQAKIVQTDIGLSGGIDLKEVPGLGNEIDVYNKADKSEFLEIGPAADSISATRELIKIKLAKGGASDESIGKLKNLLTKGDYTVDDQIDEGEKTASGITIMYSDDQQKNNVDNIKDFLSQNNFKVTVSKDATVKPADTIIVVAGK